MARLRMLLAFWRFAYSASTWRRFAYALVAAVVTLPLAVAGRAPAAARRQRALAAALLGTPTGEASRRPVDPTTIALSAAIAAVAVACWLLRWRFTYAILPLPLAAGLVTVALRGRGPARPAAAAPPQTLTPRWAGAHVAVHAVAVIVVSLVSWTLLSYLAFFALANLGFPFRLALWISEPASGGPPAPWALWSTLHRLPHHASIWAATYPTSDGGPTLAGAWTYHAAAFAVTIFPLLAWAVRGLTRLQAGLTRALLNSPSPAPAGQRPARQPDPATHGWSRTVD